MGRTPLGGGLHCPVKGCRANPYACEAEIGEILRRHHAMLLIGTKTAISIVYYDCVNVLRKMDREGLVR